MASTKKSSVQDEEVLNSVSTENAVILPAEMTPEEKANARFEAQLAKLEESRKKFIEKETARIEREKAKAESNSPWSATLNFMVSNPDIEMKDLEVLLQGKGVDIAASKSTIHTTYAYVRRVVKGLRENGLMA